MRGVGGSRDEGAETGEQRRGSILLEVFALPREGVGGSRDEGAETGEHFARSIFNFFSLLYKHVKRRVLT